MTRKMITGVLLSAVLAVSAGTCMFAESAETPERVEAGGIAFDIPEDIRGLVTVQTEDLPAGELVRVSETASIEAAAKTTPDYDGAGWLFSISCIPETELEQLRCGGMDGMEVFAEKDDTYYLYLHPTDVRFVREQYDDIDEDLDVWADLNNWAYTTVRDEILKNDPELDAEKVSNTVLDMYLARIAFQGDRNFLIKSLEFQTLDPSKLEDDEYIEDLTDDVIYELLYDEEAPDGEYIVLAFDEDNIRFDFFLADPSSNLIREVYTIDGEEYTEMYRAVFEDEDKTAVGIMQKWCEKLAEVQ